MNRRFAQLRELMLTVVPALLLVGGAFWVASKFLAPTPPKTIAIGAASKVSPYYQVALQYAEYFKKNGVTLDVRETRGSFDNLALLRDANSGVVAAFVQGGIASAKDSDNLYSLGRIFYEPVWIFQRKGETITRLTDLKGKRVLVGPAGSGTEAVALRLLGASGVTKDTATLLNSELPDYPDAFAKETADAGFLVLGPQAQTVKRLFASPAAQIVSLAQADAYAQRYPSLVHIELKQGVVDFANNIPATDTQMLSTTAAVVVRRDLHPGLADLLTQALIAAHSQPRFEANGEAALLHRAGAFPKHEDQEIPMSPDAARVYKSGPRYLQQFMPFWVATIVDRLLILLVPVIGILLPTLRFAPMLYTWRVRRRIIYWYKELKKVEAGYANAPGDVGRALDEIDRIEDAVNRIPVPLAFANQLYDLRQHIDVVRRRLHAARAGSQAS